MVTSVQLENKIEKVKDRINRLNKMLEYEYAYTATDRVRKDKGLIKKKSELSRLQHSDLRIKRFKKELKLRQSQLQKLEKTIPHKYTKRIER